MSFVATWFTRWRQVHASILMRVRMVERSVGVRARGLACMRTGGWVMAALGPGGKASRFVSLVLVLHLLLSTACKQILALGLRLGFGAHAGGRKRWFAQVL